MCVCTRVGTGNKTIRLLTLSHSDAVQRSFVLSFYISLHVSFVQLFVCCRAFLCCQLISSNGEQLVPHVTYSGLIILIHSHERSTLLQYLLRHFRPIETKDSNNNDIIILIIIMIMMFLSSTDWFTCF